MFPLAAGLFGSFVAKSLLATGMANSVMSNVISVTGDAHQAQTAQDVFRADIRHELSLMVREDMRDVHDLMIETVTTHSTMGSIVLGVGFAILIEGYVETGSPPKLIEFWALFTSWALLLTILALLLVNYFQTIIKNKVREHLLLKHRIYTPSDGRISRLGGMSMVDRFSHAHYVVLDALVDLIPNNWLLRSPHMEDTYPDDVADAPSGRSSVRFARSPTPGAHEAVRDDRSGQGSNRGASFSTLRRALSHSAFGDGYLRTLAQRRTSMLARAAAIGIATGEELEEDGPLVQLDPPPWCPCQDELYGAAEVRNCCSLANGFIIEAQPGVKAWYGPGPNGRCEFHMTEHRLSELPGFLENAALVRQSWAFATGGQSAIQLTVRDEATMYIACRPLRLPEEEEEAAGGVSEQLVTATVSARSAVSRASNISGRSSATSASSAVAQVAEVVGGPGTVRALLPGEFPQVFINGQPLPVERNFERVDGFGVFIDTHLERLPIYRLSLDWLPVTSYREPYTISLTWQFQRSVEAPLVFLRRGWVCTSEEDFPKEMFLQEMEVFRPFLAYTSLYIKCGTSFLILAAFTMHLCRVLPLRPWPACASECSSVSLAAALALCGCWLRLPTGRSLLQREARDVSQADWRALFYSRSWATCIVRCGGLLTTPLTLDLWFQQPVKHIVSARLERRCRRNWTRMAIISSSLLFLFAASFLWLLCLPPPEGRGDGPDAGADRSSHPAPVPPWGVQTASWPPLAPAPVAAASGIDDARSTAGSDGFFWVATAWLLWPLWPTAGGSEPWRPGPIQRLPFGPLIGLAALGESHVAASEDGFLHILNLSTAFSVDEGPDDGFVGLVTAPLAVPVGPPIVLNVGSVSAIAGSGNGDDLSSSSAKDVLVVATGAEAIMYSVSGVDTAVSDGEAQFQPLARVPLGSALTAGAKVASLHFGTVGECGTFPGGPWLWVSDSAGGLAALSLSSADILHVAPPWPSASGRQVSALVTDGEGALLLALAATEEAPGVEIRSAPCADLFRVTARRMAEL